MPLLPPRLLSILDALHIRVPLRTAVFGTIDFFFNRARIPLIRSRIACLERMKRAELTASPRPIKVCFLCMDRSQWVFQSVYDYMDRSPDFEPFVLTSAKLIRNVDGQADKREFLDFFHDRGMKAVTELASDNLPDVAILPRIDIEAFGSAFNSAKLYSRILCCCQTYAWLLHDCDKAFLGTFGHVYMWRYFTFTERDQAACKRLSPISGTNSVCIGFPRNDEFFSAKPDMRFWKIPHATKIIWAPHWSVLTHGNFGNFDRYANKMLAWTKAHPETCVVLKPHPLLRKRMTDPDFKAWCRSIETNKYAEPTSLATEEAFDAFMQEWRSLPNASIMDSGGYSGLFASSDAMILDSGSFLGEYMTFDKPMCFMNRNRTREELLDMFNEFGKDLMGAVDIADEWPDAERFLESVAAGQDDQSPRRRFVIEKYFSVNKGRVGEAMSLSILHSLRS
ncbi:MAG: CDP-glycerol glycerophosphotransferase family protein [Kiritimatiellae bacterium]|nr:CDP-glycerol glycerophosphotransferase family protein [Kiritimatiellia bacterium]